MAPGKQTYHTFLFVLACGLITAGRLSAQESSELKETTLTATDSEKYNSFDSPPVLSEIKLSPDGVTAVDTLGNDLSYDFVDGKFIVVESADRELSIDDRDLGSDADNTPVEDRCVRELSVNAWENTVRVEYDQYVDNDIIAYGRVTIKGWVRGNVKSLNNRVLITSSGVVEGDVVAPDVIVRDGGVVHGKVIRTGNPLDLEDLRWKITVDGVIVVASFTIMFILCSFLVAPLMPRQLAALNTCMKQFPARSFLLGFFLTILMPLVIVLVIITIIGVVLVPLVPLIYLAGFILGLIAFGSQLGTGLMERFGLPSTGLLSRTLAGVSLFMIPWFGVAFLLGMTSETATGFGIALLVLSIVFTVYPLATGLGAVVLTRFGFRPYTGSKDVPPPGGSTRVPAPPPIPDQPPSPGPIDRRL